MKYVIVLITAFALVSCNRGPKVISSPTEAKDDNETISQGIFSDDNGSVVEANNNRNISNGSINSDVHTVRVKEVLPTDKYVYMYVTEGDEAFWVACTKQEVKVGETYFYKGGLLKRNFESKEYNRTFDKVYLVSKIVPVNHGGNGNNATASSNEGKKTALITAKDFDRKGSTQISEVINNPEKYKGKKVQFTGQCTKLNANIMGRNWIHLKDGSADDYDFVLTSENPIPEGHVVTMTGEVTLDKDFGAGYRYDIIVENAVVVR